MVNWNYNRVSCFSKLYLPLDYFLGDLAKIWCGIKAPYIFDLIRYPLRHNKKWTAIYRLWDKKKCTVKLHIFQKCIYCFISFWPCKHNINCFIMTKTIVTNWTFNKHVYFYMLLKLYVLLFGLRVACHIMSRYTKLLVLKGSTFAICFIGLGMGYLSTVFLLYLSFK